MNTERPSHLTNPNVQIAISKNSSNQETSINEKPPKVTQSVFQTLKNIFFLSTKISKENALKAENDDWVMVPSQKEKKEKIIVKINQKIEELQKSILEKKSEIELIKITIQAKQAEVFKINTRIRSEEISLEGIRTAYEKHHPEGIFAEDTDELKILKKLLDELKRDKGEIAKELTTNERTLHEKSQAIEELLAKIQLLSEKKESPTPQSMKI